MFFGRKNLRVPPFFLSRKTNCQEKNAREHYKICAVEKRQRTKNSSIGEHTADSSSNINRRLDLPEGKQIISCGVPRLGGISSG